MEKEPKQTRTRKTSTQSPRTVAPKGRASKVEAKKPNTKARASASAGASTKTRTSTKTANKNAQISLALEPKRKRPSPALKQASATSRASATKSATSRASTAKSATSRANAPSRASATKSATSRASATKSAATTSRASIVSRGSKDFVQFSDISKEQSFNDKEEDALAKTARDSLTAHNAPPTSDPLAQPEPNAAPPTSNALPTSNSLAQRTSLWIRSLFLPKKESSPKQSKLEKKIQGDKSLGQGLEKQELDQEFDSTIFQKEAIEKYRGKHEQYVLDVEGLHKKFGRKEVVSGISFSVQTGEVVGFLGPNGAGKTTAFYMVVGFITPDKGSIILNGKKINNLAMHQRARLGISYLPQEPSVFRRLSVENNILAILETIPKLSRAEMKERLEILIRDFGLQSIRKQKAFTLSGGERRRTEIARSMSLKPHFLLLDEPFTGIDPKARHELKLIISALAKRGVGILITDHNERDTLSITERVYILNQGKIAVSGSQEEIMSNVQVREIYLGRHYDI